MAKFFKGQRVRIRYVKYQRNAHLVGMEDFISAVDDRFEWTMYATASCPFQREIVNAGVVHYGFAEDQLEPILPEGSAPSEFTFQQLMDSLQEAMA